MKRLWLLILLGAALLAPALALGEQSPEVIFAVPGSGGTNGGAINRFTIRFSVAMVPLGDPRAAPPATSKCPIPGTSRWVDPQTWVLEFERPLPGGVSCTVSLNSGLKSQGLVAVQGTRDFVIDTGGPSARAVLPGEHSADIEEDQAFLVATNTPATSRSIASSGYCAVEGIGEKIPLTVLGPETASRLMADLGPENWSLREFLESAGLQQTLPANAKDRSAALASVTAVQCGRPLPPGKDVSLVWASGIAAANGHLAGRDQRFDFTVRDAFVARFECSRVNTQSGCNPIQNANVRFTSPVPATEALAVRLRFADGTVRTPKVDDEQKGNATLSDLKFAGPFAGDIGAILELPAGLKDESGRSLSNASRFPLSVRFDAPPPLVKFSGNFGILEAGEGGVLPVTVRLVESQLSGGLSRISGDKLRIEASDGEIARWLRRVDEAQEDRSEDIRRGKEVITRNMTGARSLLSGEGAKLSVPLPGSGKAFEVVGIPLKEEGFYVVEIASPTLGRTLLGRPATRYVATAALVTNMAVHFKWGREKSLAWVTMLGDAAPVSSAVVRITDSCTGKLLAEGRTDRFGRLAVSGLGEPQSGGGCDPSSDHPLMVSARAANDFSFTMTSWSEGITPYDFDLNYGWSPQEDIVHTVFDRSLVRQGETVNMKHFLRRPVGAGFALGEPVTGTLKLTHTGSGTEFPLPLKIGADGSGENNWTAPPGAPMGDYQLSYEIGGETRYSGQTVKVDEFRLPTMRSTISGPKMALVRPDMVPLSLFVGYLSGGPAGNLPVSIRSSYELSDTTPKDWDGWSFGGRALEEGTVALNSDGINEIVQLPPGQATELTLASDGTAAPVIDVANPIESETRLNVEMDYQDANGEVLTARHSIPLLPSAIRLGLKTDGWLMKADDLRLKLVALSTEDQPLKGRVISVEVFARETLTARRRLIGGFYAYDNQMRTRKLAARCSTTTDGLGLASCKLDPGTSGEVTVVATTTDNDGYVARAVQTVWLVGEDDWWFGGDNGDRMDIIPEAKAYRSGDTARIQVRMPFRKATALVTVEREGVLSSFVTEISGKDPVIKVPMPVAYAPNVYVSVLAVRGRVSGWKLWTAKMARDWGLPFLSRDGYEPTALVDLAKPSYRLGMTRINVGHEGNTLGVRVKTDRTRYSVRETANVDVAVTEPSGKPARSAEIAFAAVDEALLQLSPNDSWQLVDAMVGDRPISVITSTAQMQVVGKRHYGKKAVESGGGGGADNAITRTDFKPVLLWRGRVALDGQGRARVHVPLADSLSAYKLVAIANGGAQLFGTGSTEIRTAQDLTVYSGIPPLVRSGDWFGASFTLRNGTDRPMTVTANVSVTPAVAKGEPLTVTIPAGGSAPVTWHMTAPENAAGLVWKVEARATQGNAVDSIEVSQTLIPAIPSEVWAGTLTRIGSNTSMPLQAPTGAIAGRSFVDVKLSDTLAPPLEGVRTYMSTYPYSCFEQQTSRLIVMGDGAGWDKLAAEIPAYLDSDGLLRYWPVQQLAGSEALTAYVLNITADAGFTIPQEPKAKMIEAMKGVLNGKLKHDAPWGGNDSLLRLAALSALARTGEATPAMLGQIGLAPADMPTAELADWLLIIDHTKGANTSLRTSAEAILRQRLVFEGSRLDLTDRDNAPWWMMTSRDEMAIKALLAVLGRPGWNDDEAKMMVGVALRQQRGHWDSTPANAWGSVLARKFAARYPANAISGTTTASLGDATRSQSWPMPVGAPPMRLPVPASRAPLVLSQAGGAGPWAMVSLIAAVPLTSPLAAGYRVEKQVSAVTRAKAGEWTRGDVVRVRLTITALAGRNWVVINDPIPPGATVIGSLGGQSVQLAQQNSSNDTSFPSYVDRGNDGWRGYFEWVPEGKLITEYTMRLNGSGKFNLPPTRVEAMYSPDVRGALPNQPIAVSMR